MSDKANSSRRPAAHLGRSAAPANPSLDQSSEMEEAFANADLYLPDHLVVPTSMQRQSSQRGVGPQSIPDPSRESEGVDRSQDLDASGYQRVDPSHAARQARQTSHSAPDLLPTKATPATEEPTLPGPSDSVARKSVIGAEGVQSIGESIRVLETTDADLSEQENAQVDWRVVNSAAARLLRISSEAELRDVFKSEGDGPPTAEATPVEICDAVEDDSDGKVDESNGSSLDLSAETDGDATDIELNSAYSITTHENELDAASLAAVAPDERRHQGPDADPVATMVDVVAPSNGAPFGSESIVSTSSMDDWVAPYEVSGVDQTLAPSGANIFLATATEIAEQLPQVEAANMTSESELQTHPDPAATMSTATTPAATTLAATTPAATEPAAKRGSSATKPQVDNKKQRASHEESAIEEAEEVAARAAGSGASRRYRLDASTDQPVAAPKIELVHYQAAQLAELRKLQQQQTMQEAPVELPAVTRDRNEVEQSVSSSPESRSKSQVELAAAWEVDFFRWTEISNRLLTHEAINFDTVLKSLGVADGSSAHLIYVTGIRPGEGRSTLSVCLARRAARSGLRTLLVDGDLAQPGLAQMAGLEFDFGWLNPEAAVDIQESLVRCLMTDLHLIPTGDVGEVRENALVDRWERMLHRVAQDFDVVIIDSGLVDRMARPLRSMESLKQTALLVQNESATHSPAIVDAYRHLQSLGIEAIAIAETFSQKMAG